MWRDDRAQSGITVAELRAQAAAREQSGLLGPTPTPQFDAGGTTWAPGRPGLGSAALGAGFDQSSKSLQGPAPSCGEETLTTAPWPLLLEQALRPLLSRYEAEVVEATNAVGVVVARELRLKPLQPSLDVSAERLAGRG